MKFLHVSDIHLGKRLHGCGLAEDQEQILCQILALAKREDCDAVLVAGDVYNRAQPQPEAIAQFSRFLTQLAEVGKPVLIVRGNHDGEAQLAYAAPLLRRSGLYVNRAFDGDMDRVILRDGFGEIHVWLLPFVKPLQVRRCFPEAKLESYGDALAEIFRHAQIDPGVRNVLVTHQYVSGAEISDSEERMVGGLDQIPPSVFAPFDYVALGHLHKAQTMAGGRLRYCGAPLVYSFDECSQTKSATLVTVGAKGTANEFELVPFAPLHPCRRIEGTLEALAAQPRSEDYVQAVLTDAVRPLDPFGTLRVTYPNLLNLMLVNAAGELEQRDLPQLQPDADLLEHFSEFYLNRNGREPSAAELDVIREILQEGGERE